MSACKPRDWMARGALAVFAGVLALIAPACGGGGGGGGPTQPPAPQTGITFTPSGTAAGNSVSLSRQGQSTTVLTLQVDANQLTDLYGVSFDLRFPTAALTFTGFTEGGLLNAGGAATSAQVVESPPGNLVVGISRLGAVGGVTGSGTLLTLNFSAVASGNGALTFAGPQAFSSGGTIASTQFIGGSVQVIR